MDETKKNIVNDPGIRLAISDQELAGRIKVRLPNNDDPVYWYIKFNTVLDEHTVSHKTMTVTEENGYILDTEITYDITKNVIVIKPTDPYEEGIYYILTVTKKVSSKGGNRLKKDIHILFKIKDKRIDEYKTLPPETVVQKPRVKPEKLKREIAARAFFPDAVPKTAPKAVPKYVSKLAKTKTASLPYGKMKINIILAVLGIPVTVTGLFLNIELVVYGGAGILILGIVHLIVQMANKRKQSAVLYNIGVMFFNSGSYKKAAKRLAKSARLDPGNKMAEHAATEVKHYL
jgi:hypothetical protein